MYYTVSLRLFVYEILKGELKNLIMAGNNSIQILRANSNAIASSSETLLPGQLLYNMDKNYLTVGGGQSGNTPVNALPISCRELIGYIGDDGVISNTTTIGSCVTCNQENIDIRSSNGNINISSPVVSINACSAVFDGNSDIQVHSSDILVCAFSNLNLHGPNIRFLGSNIFYDVSTNINAQRIGINANTISGESGSWQIYDYNNQGIIIDSSGINISTYGLPIRVQTSSSTLTLNGGTNSSVALGTNYTGNGVVNINSNAVVWNNSPVAMRHMYAKIGISSVQSTVGGCVSGTIYCTLPVCSAEDNYSGLRMAQTTLHKYAAEVNNLHIPASGYVWVAGQSTRNPVTCLVVKASGCVSQTNIGVNFITNNGEATAYVGNWSLSQYESKEI